MIIKNISKYLESKGIKVSIAEKEIGLSNGSLSKPINNNKDIKTNTLEKFLKNYPEINPTWLLTGKGSMLKEEEEVATALPILQSITGSTKPIPLVSHIAAAGFGTGTFAIGEQDVKEYYVVPKFKHNRIDFMIEVRGNSMYPKYNSGDIVACTILKESNFIQPNKPHLIATMEQGILVKRIVKENKDSMVLRSDNKDYTDFVVPKSEVTGIAIIVGVIRIE